MRWRERQSEKKVDGKGREAVGKNIYLYCVCVFGPRFSFNVSGEGRRVSPMLLSRGDCHQFLSWHLNHPLQIWVFEMQIQLRTPRQIKRHTHRSGKKTPTLLKMYIFLLVFFISGVCVVKRTLFCLFPEWAVTVADTERPRVIIFVFVVLSNRRTESHTGRRREDGEVLFFFISPLASLFAPHEVCSIERVFFFFYYSHPTDRAKRKKNMIHIFPPLSISLTLQLFKHQ